MATVDESGVVVQYQPPPRRSATDKLERKLWRLIDQAGLPAPDELEYRWARAAGRMFRADAYYKPDLLLEVDGGLWMPGGSGHSHPMHLETQHERDNLAVLLGFRVLRFTQKMIDSGDAIRTLRRALAGASQSPDQLALPSTIGALQSASSSAAANGLERGIKGA